MRITLTKLFAELNVKLDQTCMVKYLMVYLDAIIRRIKKKLPVYFNFEQKKRRLEFILCYFFYHIIISKK